MSQADHTCRMRAGAAVVLLASWAVRCLAAPGDASPGGGFMSAPRKTRQELVREWDLNSDGTIDAGEVEIAASKMRRDRAELRLNSGIDPVTGLPRGTDVLAPDPGAVDDDAERTRPAEEPPADDAAEQAKPSLPGTRVPRPAAAATARPQDKPQDMPQAGGRPAGGAAPKDLRRQPLTGGVRAGGLPARAGYGAGDQAKPLNAGLPIVPQTRAAPAPAPGGRSGLVPAPRPVAPAVRPSRPRDLYDPY